MRPLQLDAANPGSARMPRLGMVACLLFAVLMDCMPLPAAEEAFSVVQSTREQPEMGTFPEYVVLTGASRVGVLPPQNSRVETDYAARRLKLQVQDSKASIVLEFTTNRFGIVTTNSSARLLQLVQNRFPDAAIQPARIAYLGTDKGLAFDVERTTVYKTRLTTRMAFVSTPEGLLEISMTTSTDYFASLEGTFTTFLGCVQIRPDKRSDG